MITQELEENINFTHADARRRRLSLITVEHLTLTLIENSSARRCLSDCRADVQSLREDLSHFVDSQVPKAIEGESPEPNAEFQRVIKRAAKQVRVHHREKISGAHVLAAILAEPESHAAYYLCKHGVERLAVLARANQYHDDPVSPFATKLKSKPSSLLENKNLVRLAKSGELEMPFGRECEVADIARILGRKYKNNPLLVGESGVGKTAIAHKLAHYALSDGAPPSLKGLSLFSVSVGNMVAGTKYRGDFEQRMQQLIEKCKECDNAVLFIDEIHTIIGAGAVSGGNLDAANMMKSLLGSGVRCIGATTFAEYRRIFEKDMALSRRFHKVYVNEPNDKELSVILSGVTARLATHHGVSYAESTPAAAIKYARQFLPDKFFPDKAIDILDDAGSRKRGNGDAVDDNDIFAAATALGGVAKISRAHDDLGNLERDLSEAVIGQQEAARQLANAVLRQRLGYHENTRVAGAFMFAGPTGVGKTEMAKQLSQLLRIPLLRFDMSEYMEAHAVSRLIGAPPGYIGFENSGKLVEQIIRHPHSVILLDEIEKAHPEALNIFLQVMDYGVLTDNVGRRADFSHAILIMTSNVGATEWERAPMGYERDDAAQAGAEVLSRHFTPEFRNRLDAVIRFSSLTPQMLSIILNNQILQMQKQVYERKGINFKIGRRLRAALLADGFSATMGARPLERLLRERILNTLATAEAQGIITTDGVYHIEQEQDGTAQIHAAKQTRRRAVVA